MAKKKGKNKKGKAQAAKLPSRPQQSKSSKK